MSNQPPYGAPNQYGMSQPSGQPPKKSNAGLIAAIVALVLAVAAVTVALVVVLNKDDDSDASPDSSSSSRSSESTSSSSDASSQSSDPTSDPTSDAPDPSGEQVRGTGYTYQLPTGWREDPDAFGSGFDTGSLWVDGPDNSRTNLLVQRGQATDATDLEAARDSWQANLSSREQDESQLPDTTIAGHDAIGVRMASTTDKGTESVSLAYLVVADRHPYTIVMTSERSNESAAKQALDEIFASWTFDRS